MERTPEQKEAQRLQMQQQARDIRSLMKYYKTSYPHAQKLYFDLKRSEELEQVLMEQKSGGEAPETNENACPLCNAPMQIKQGPYSTFWGCSRFPKCRGTREIKVEEKPVAEAAIADAKRCLDLAMTFVTDIGGIEKAKKYLGLAQKMLEA